jgi:hypothetical protein
MAHFLQRISNMNRITADEQLAIVKTGIFKAAIVELADMDIDAELREDYSGRGMYGKKCLGIVANCSGVQIGMAFALALFDQTNDLDMQTLIDVTPKRSDSMGKDFIYY